MAYAHFFFAIISLVCTPALAQSYPAKAINIIAAAPGGGTDLLARVIADKLRDKFGQPATVENRSGAGNIGADAVFKAAPDGTRCSSRSPRRLW